MSQAVRRSARAEVLVAALLSVIACGGCSSASDPSPPTGVDELVIPTPSPDPRDFVETVDNPWLALADDDVLTYEVTGGRPGTRRIVATEPGPEIESVATTAVSRVDEAADPATGDAAITPVATDYYAQDEGGNVWWFGSEGEWQAGAAGAEAGLVMAAAPRLGDGYRSARVPGLVDVRAEVVAVDATVEVGDRRYDGVVVVETTDATGRVESSSYVEGVGLVLQETLEGQPRLRVELLAGPGAG